MTAFPTIWSLIYCFTFYFPAIAGYDYRFTVRLVNFYNAAGTTIDRAPCPMQGCNTYFQVTINKEPTCTTTVFSNSNNVTSDAFIQRFAACRFLVKSITGPSPKTTLGISALHSQVSYGRESSKKVMADTLIYRASMTVDIDVVLRLNREHGSGEVYTNSNPSATKGLTFSLFITCASEFCGNSSQQQTTSSVPFEYPEAEQVIVLPPHMLVIVVVATSSSVLIILAAVIYVISARCRNGRRKECVRDVVFAHSGSTFRNTYAPEVMFLTPEQSAEARDGDIAPHGQAHDSYECLAENGIYDQPSEAPATRENIYKNSEEDCDMYSQVQRFHL